MGKAYDIEVTLARAERSMCAAFGALGWQCVVRRSAEYALSTINVAHGSQRGGCQFDEYAASSVAALHLLLDEIAHKCGMGKTDAGHEALEAAFNAAPEPYVSSFDKPPNCCTACHWRRVHGGPGL